MTLAPDRTVAHVADGGEVCPRCNAFANAGLPAPMTVARAREINDALFAVFMVSEGLRDGGAPSLQGFTLEELLEATRIVEAENRAAEKAGGSYTVYCVCDPRLIAAMYACTHYPADSDPENVTTLVQIGHKGLVCLDMSVFGRPDAE
jgi:hypothetical protein